VEGDVTLACLVVKGWEAPPRGGLRRLVTGAAPEDLAGGVHPRGYLSHHLAAISMAAVYTDAAHIADGVIGLKQRSLAASDPAE